MSIEDIHESQASVMSKRNRVPVASADGTSSARLNDNNPGRRKRVRITTSDADPNIGQRRFGAYRPEHSRGEYSAYDKQRTPREHYGNHNNHNERYARERTNENNRREEYQERYQAQRSEGNYDYNYNRTNKQSRPNNGTRKGGFQAQGKTQRPNGQRPQKPQKGKIKITDARAPHVPLEPVKYPQVLDPDTEIRLNKYLANAGVCSRREADVLIAKGEIMVNGEVITELGHRVTPKDEVMHNGVRVESESKVYILLNKPKNCVTTSDDPECRLTVMDLVRNACPERTYPVGRLDRQTTGVLLITNDGDLAAKLTHPSFLKKKIYHVWLDKPVTMEHMQAIADGFELEDGEIHADALSYVTEDDLTQVGIEIHSGRNRIVRRIFEHFGYQVQKLDRVYFAGLTKKNLPRGKWRYLNEQEVNNLRMGAFE